MSLPEHVNRPADGNEPAPILTQGTTPLARRPHPWEALIESGKHARRADVLKAKRSVHAGSLSHETEGQP